MLFFALKKCIQAFQRKTQMMQSILSHPSWLHGKPYIS